jgi:hypothetical protein
MKKQIYYQCLYSIRRLIHTIQYVDLHFYTSERNNYVICRMSSFYDSRIVVLNNIGYLIVYIVKTRNYGKLKVVDLYNPKSFPIFQIKNRKKKTFCIKGNCICCHVCAFNDEIWYIVFWVTTLLLLIIVIQPSPEKFLETSDVRPYYYIIIAFACIKV